MVWVPAGPRFTAAGQGLGLGPFVGKTPLSVAVHSSSRSGQSPLLVNTGTAGEATSTLSVGLRAAPSLHHTPRFHCLLRSPEPAPWRGPDSCLPDRMSPCALRPQTSLSLSQASQAWGLAVGIGICSMHTQSGQSPALLCIQRQLLGMAKVTLGTQKPQTYMGGAQSPPPHASAAQALALPSKVARAVSAGSWAVLQSTHVTAPMQGTTPGHQTQVQEVGDHAEASFNTGAGLFWVKEEMPFPGSPVFPKARGPGTVQCQMSSGPWKSLSSSAPPRYWWLRDWQLCPGCHGGTYPLEQGLSSVKTSSQASRFVHSAGWPWSTSPKHKRLKSQMPKKMSQDVWRTPVP